MKAEKKENEKRRNSPEAAEADRILCEMALLQERQTKIKGSIERRINSIRLMYAGELAANQGDFKALEKKLEKHIKAARNALFEGPNDRLDLPHGALVWVRAEKVKHSRDVTVERLEDLGEPYAEAVKIDKRVDWETIEKWTAERLAELKLERKPKDDFSFELAAVGARHASPKG